jgi:hypothetical protein
LLLATVGLLCLAAVFHGLLFGFPRYGDLPGSGA